MNPILFLRLLLLAPLLLPLLFVALGPARGGVALVLFGSLVFWVVPYLVTAIALWIRLGRCTSQTSALALVFKAPLVFVSVQAIAILIWTMFQLASAGADVSAEIFAGLMLVLAMAIYGLLLGYLYASFAAIALLLAVRVRLASGFSLAGPP